MAKERCNCDASCGENRYHDVGDPGCRFADDDNYRAYWKIQREGSLMNTPKENKMAKVSIIGKLSKVSESFTVNMYDNGFMVEITGRDKKEDWKTTKIMVSSIDELVSLIKEAAEMERDS
jgi:hypothetical protein